MPKQKPKATKHDLGARQRQLYTARQAFREAELAFIAAGTALKIAQAAVSDAESALAISCGLVLQKRTP